MKYPILEFSAPAKVLYTIFKANQKNASLSDRITRCFGMLLWKVQLIIQHGVVSLTSSGDPDSTVL